MNTTMGKRSSQARSNSRPHVLLVDTHQDCLAALESLFQERNFRVTRCQDSERCLAMTLEKKQAFDLAVIEAQMPGIDGLELIRLLSKKTIIPIILTSRDSEANVIRKGMEYGACDFFQKPISMEQVGAIDLGVLRARAANKVAFESGIEEDSNVSRNSRNPSVDSGSVDSKLCAVKREGDPINCLDRPPNKKPRVIWTEELHAKFVAAVDMFGIDKAVPKKILEVMNVPDLTRENVASHLQKYRQYHKKNGALQQPNSAVATETQNVPDPIPMATLPRLFDEMNVDLYQKAISSFGCGAEETALPITQALYENSVMLPENGMGRETEPIMDRRQQNPPIGEPNGLSHHSMNQTQMPGGRQQNPPIGEPNGLSHHDMNQIQMLGGRQQNPPIGELNGLNHHSMNQIQMPGGRQQNPPIGEPNGLNHHNMNQTQMPGGGSFQPPVNYAEEFVPNFGNSLGGADPLNPTQYDRNWLGYSDLTWQDPAVNLQPPPQPLSVYDYLRPNGFNQGGYDPTLHENQFHQLPNQATAGDQFYFPGFPQGKPKFG